MCAKLSMDLDDPENLPMVLVMGITGSGKSRFINTLAGRQATVEGHQLESCISSTFFEDSKHALIFEKRYFSLSSSSMSNRGE